MFGLNQPLENIEMASLQCPFPTYELALPFQSGQSSVSPSYLSLTSVSASLSSPPFCPSRPFRAGGFMITGHAGIGFSGLCGLSATLAR